MTSQFPFVLTGPDQGTLIVNRFDYHIDPALNSTYGIGLELLDTANYEGFERDAISQMLQLRRSIYGDGVMALDVGANIGAHSVAWARTMRGWGQLIAMEPQEWVYYALCGNLALNNCLNARALHVAVGSKEGTLGVPSLDPSVPANFGGLELGPLGEHHPEHQPIGAPVDREHLQQVPMITLNSLGLSRLDLLKIDVEGMELAALEGAIRTLERYKPILIVEWPKSPQVELVALMTQLGYLQIHRYSMNLIAVHPDDPCKERINFSGAQQ